MTPSSALLLSPLPVSSFPLTLLRHALFKTLFQALHFLGHARGYFLFHPLFHCLGQAPERICHAFSVVCLFTFDSRHPACFFRASGFSPPPVIHSKELRKSSHIRTKFMGGTNATRFMRAALAIVPHYTGSRARARAREAGSLSGSRAHA